jgi:hypothetical protein
MEHDKMTVTTENGTCFNFFKENDTLKLIIFDNIHFQENEIREDSIHAVIGEPLTFTYYYGYGSSEEFTSKTPVKKIE